MPQRSIIGVGIIDMGFARVIAIAGLAFFNTQPGGRKMRPPAVSYRISYTGWVSDACMSD